MSIITNSFSHRNFMGKCSLLKTYLFLTPKLEIRINRWCWKFNNLTLFSNLLIGVARLCMYMTVRMYLFLFTTSARKSFYTNLRNVDNSSDSSRKIRFLKFMWLFYQKNFDIQFPAIYCRPSFFIFRRAQVTDKERKGKECLVFLQHFVS